MIFAYSVFPGAVCNAYRVASLGMSFTEACI